MESKLAKLTTAAYSGDWTTALRIAATFPNLGKDAETIRIAGSATRYPAMYSEMGKNPETLIQAGIAALKERYGLMADCSTLPQSG